MFGVIFYLFNVDLNDESSNLNSNNININDIKLSLTNISEGVTQLHQNNDLSMGQNHENNFLTQFVPGPPFVFGSMMVSFFSSYFYFHERQKNPATQIPRIYETLLA